MAMSNNDMINYGILTQNKGQQGQPKTQVQNIKPMDPNQNGQLTKALNNLFGTNPVSQATQALANSIATNPDNGNIAPGANNQPTNSPMLPGPANTSATALNDQGEVFGPNYGQPKNAQGELTNPNANKQLAQFSIPNVYQTAKDVYGDNTHMAKLATAQAIQESRLNGTPSTLATNANNLFGIKGKGSAGSVTMMTHEYVNGKMVAVPQEFAAYKSPRDSMIAHKALMSSSRYKGVGRADSVEDGAQALQDAGYATDPNYAKGLTAASKLIPDDNTQVASNSDQDVGNG
jgi:flagellum-specific peptidoglycan hydrolase FlgJ